MKKETKESLLALAIEFAKIVLTAMLAVLGTISMTSCNVTRAAVTHSRDGSSTTITITTNNPTTTEIPTNLNLDRK